VYEICCYEVVDPLLHPPVVTVSQITSCRGLDLLLQSCGSSVASSCCYGLSVSSLSWTIGIIAPELWIVLAGRRGFGLSFALASGCHAYVLGFNDASSRCRHLLLISNHEHTCILQSSSGLT
jgi:hypothetical protein